MKAGYLLWLLTIGLVAVVLVFPAACKVAPPATTTPVATTPPVTTTPPATTTPTVTTTPQIFEVTIAGFAFTPEELTIPAGSIVIWTNFDEEIHTVTSDNGIFESGGIDDNSSWSNTFNEPGIFTYHCIPHPFMTAVIIVE